MYSFCSNVTKTSCKFLSPVLPHLNTCSVGGGGGTDTPLFYQDEYVPLNRVWFSGFRALNRVYRRPLNDERSILVVHIPKNVSRKILFSDVSLENYFTVFVERIETGS